MLNSRTLDKILYTKHPQEEKIRLLQRRPVFLAKIDGLLGHALVHMRPPYGVILFFVHTVLPRISAHGPNRGLGPFLRKKRIFGYIPMGL